MRITINKVAYNVSMRCFTNDDIFLFTYIDGVEHPLNLQFCKSEDTISFPEFKQRVTDEVGHLLYKLG